MYVSLGAEYALLDYMTEVLDYSEDSLGGFQDERIRLVPNSAWMVSTTSTEGVAPYDRCSVSNDNTLLRRAWLDYMCKDPPTVDVVLQGKQNSWEIPGHNPNYTLTRAAYRTYNT